jgi:hypothetical protein
MVANISHDNVTVTGTIPHQYTAFASDLGLRPGEWPPALPVAADFGNGLSLVPIHYRAERVLYKQQFGCVLVAIFND